MLIVGSAFGVVGTKEVVMFPVSRLIRLVYALLAALVLVVGIPLTTGAWFTPAPIECDIASSLFAITVFVNGQEQESLEIAATSPPFPPIEVDSSAAVGILAGLVPQPSGCQAHFSIDWDLWFVGFDTRKIQTVNRPPLSEQLDITLGARPTGDPAQGLVIIIVRDARGEAVRTQTVHLKGKQ
jgi:hypothetical protein